MLSTSLSILLPWFGHAVDSFLSFVLSSRSKIHVRCQSAAPPSHAGMTPPRRHLHVREIVIMKLAKRALHFVERSWTVNNSGLPPAINLLQLRSMRAKFPFTSPVFLYSSVYHCAGYNWANVELTCVYRSNKILMNVCTWKFGAFSSTLFWF